MARRGLLALLVVVAVIALGRRLLAAAGIDSSPDALQAWILSFGWWGPGVFALLLAFRHFLLLPSSLMLALGGALLGVLVGGIVGSVGLFASATFEFWLFRALKPARLVRRMESRAGGAAAAIERGTPLAVFASTAIPPLPMTFFYWAASLTSIRMGVFAAYAGVAGVVRAFALSLLGAGLVAADATMIAIAVIACTSLLAAAAFHPRLRALLLPPSAA